MDVRVGLWRRLSAEELMLLNCGVGEDSGELDCKEIQPVHSEGDQPWDFFGRNDAKAESPVLWPPHVKSWLIGGDSDAGRDWEQEEKGTTEDEMAGWHHWLNGHESEWTPGVDDGQGGLACCNSWGRKESDTTERLIWSDSPKTYERLCAHKDVREPTTGHISNVHQEVNKLWYIHKMEHYPALKKNELLPWATTQMDLQIIKEAEPPPCPQRYDSTYVKF